MAPLGLTHPVVLHCSGRICGGNGVVDVPPATGHIGNLLVRGAGSVTLYQPASRFWEFQAIEVGIFVALTLLALGAAMWLVRRAA